MEPGWRDEYLLLEAHGPQGHHQRSEGVWQLVLCGGHWSERDFVGGGGGGCVGGRGTSYPSSPLTCLPLTSGISAVRRGARLLGSLDGAQQLLSHTNTLPPLHHF